MSDIWMTDMSVSGCGCQGHTLSTQEIKCSLHSLIRTLL